VNDEHDELRDAIRRVCSKFGDDYWRDHDEREEFPWEFYETLAEGGWIGIAIPEEYGGGGQGITAASILMEEISASGAAMNGASSIHLSIFGMNPVVKHGSPQMRARYLPRVASGALHVSFGVTGDVRLTGTNPFSSDGMISTRISERIVQAVLAATREVYGVDPDVYPWSPGSSTTWYYTRVGTPALHPPGVGYMGSLAHAPNEHIRLEDAMRSMKTIAGALLHLEPVP